MPATTQKILLDTDEVHVWLADVAGLEDGGLDRLWATLSSEEKEAIERYRFQRDRDVHILSRGGLRQILSRYAAVAPENLEFSVTPYGKPCLNSPHSTDLRFSVSHSGGLVAWALAEGREIGIDVEQVRELPDFLDIARTVFTPREREFLSELEGEERNRAFFRFWTRKEAYVKARGKGLTIPLQSFEVAGDSSQIVISGPPGDSPQGQSWLVTDLDAPTGYRGAVAGEPGYRIRHLFDYHGAL